MLTDTVVKPAPGYRSYRKKFRIRQAILARVCGILLAGNTKRPFFVDVSATLRLLLASGTGSRGPEGLTPSHAGVAV